MPASMWANGAMWAGSSSWHEHAGVVGGQRAAARRRVDDLEEAGDGLLLEPLAGVARGDAGAVGELVRRERAVALERAVEAELDAEVDGEQLERAERGAEQALGEGVGAICGFGVGGHGPQRARARLRTTYGGVTGAA